MFRPAVTLKESRDDRRVQGEMLSHADRDPRWAQDRRSAIGLDDVRRALVSRRPGHLAQQKMMARPRPGSPGFIWPDTRRHSAAVLLLLYEKRGRLYLPLTLRTGTVLHHRGQVSLPGGAREGRESLTETALRETCEELGIPALQMTIIGRLTPLHIPVSGFRTTPFVAHSPQRPDFHPQPSEVREVIEAPLAALLDPASVREEDWTIRDRPVHVPFFQVGPHKVWGATAMILAEFVEMLRDVTDCRSPKG